MCGWRMKRLFDNSQSSASSHDGRGRTLPGAVALAVLPWLAATVLASGLTLALYFVLALLMITGLGWLLLTAFGRPASDSDTALFSPAAGFIGLCALTIAGQMVGLASAMIFWAASGAGILGFVLFCRILARHPRGKALACGMWIVLLSWLVAAVYFAPSAMRNGVLSPDGVFTWIHTDTPFLNAIAATNKSWIWPPRPVSLPSGALSYHYGAYFLSTLFSLSLGIEVSAASNLLVRGVALLSLFAAALGFSRVFGRRVGAGPYAGLLGILALFFMGSPVLVMGLGIAGVSKEGTPSLLGLKLNTVLYDAQFTHFIIGHSYLWGLLGLVAVLGLLLSGKGCENGEGLVGPGSVFVLAPLVICINVFAGLGATGIVVAVSVWCGWRHLRTWLMVAVSCAVLLLSFKLICLGGGGSSLVVGKASPSVFWEFLGWALMGCGVRMLPLDLFKRERRSLVWPVLLLLFVGYSALTWLVAERVAGNQYYGKGFLQPILGIMTLVLLSGPLESLIKRDIQPIVSESVRLLRVWLTIAVLVFAVSSVVLSVDVVIGRPIAPVARVVLFSMAIVLFLLGADRLAWRWSLARRTLGVGLIMLVLLSLTAWLPAFASYAVGRGARRAVSVSPDAYQGLLALRLASKPGDLIATNKPLFQGNSASYDYAALSERYVLLEGWRYGKLSGSVFEQVRRDNEILFSTDGVSEARRIVERYCIDYLVLVPGTSLGFDVAGQSWLTELPGGGSMKVWRTVGAYPPKSETNTVGCWDSRR